MSALLLLEPSGGCSGDMTLAALLDVGAPLDAVASGLERLGLPGWTIRTEPAQKCGIHGTRLEVRLDEAHAEKERTYLEIRTLIERAGLPGRATQRAVAIFSALARAEATIHATTPEEVHFHEVGAVDSILDIVGVALALEELGVERICATAPPLGTGITNSRHGPIPIPAPATLELLRGRPVRSAGEGERTTPTGAAILAGVTEVTPFSRFVPERVGYGIGHRDFPDAANLLRATIGRADDAADGLVVIEANLDDASPQLLARAIEASLEAGALDAWVAPLTMKKGRPGHLVGLLAPARLRERLSERLFRETPTLGVRFHPVEREVLERRFETVETPFGAIRIKLGHRAERVFNAAPEWEDCLCAARRHGVAAREVREAAIAAWNLRS